MNKRRTGFVLLSVVACLALAVVVAVEMTGRNQQRGRRVLERRQKVRYRWACGSLECCLIESTRLPIGNHGRSEAMNRLVKVGKGPTLAKGTTTIGEFTFDWVLSNEQAKVNVNLLSANLPYGQFVESIRELTGYPTSKSRRLNPHPRPPDDRHYRSYDQLIAELRLSRRAWGSPSSIPVLNVTCWGPGGRLDWRCASDECLEVVARLAIDDSAVGKLVAARRALTPSDSASRWFAGAALTPAKIRELRLLFTDRSQAYSVWTSARIGLRRAKRFVVVEQVDAASRKATRWSVN